MSPDLGFGPYGILSFLIVLFWFFTVTVHSVFALGVWGDASWLSKRAGEGPALASPFWWGIATLLGGVFVAGVYWLIHHSALRPARQPGQSSEPYSGS